LQDQFRKSSNTASEEQKGKLAREIDQKQKSLQRDQEDAQAEYQQELQKLNNELGSRIMQVIDKYSRDNNFTMILDVSSQQSPVLYFATGSDVTADIVKMYDANAPTMGTVPAGGAGAPAMPKPAGAKPTAPRPAGAKP
jgi:outer membrane protein